MRVCEFPGWVPAWEMGLQWGQGGGRSGPSVSRRPRNWGSWNLGLIILG